MSEYRFLGRLRDRDQWDLWDPESLCQLPTDQPDCQARGLLTARLHRSLQGISTEKGRCSCCSEKWESWLPHWEATLSANW